MIFLLLLVTLVFYPLLAPTPHRIDEDHFGLDGDRVPVARLVGEGDGTVAWNGVAPGTTPE